MDLKIAVCCCFVVTVRTLNALAFMSYGLVPSHTLDMRVGGLALVTLVPFPFMLRLLVAFHIVVNPTAVGALVTVVLLPSMRLPLVNV
jgi:hypothetical protein